MRGEDAHFDRMLADYQREEIDEDRVEAIVEEVLDGPSDKPGEWKVWDSMTRRLGAPRCDPDERWKYAEHVVEAAIEKLSEHRCNCCCGFFPRPGALTVSECGTYPDGRKLTESLCSKCHEDGR